MVALDFPEPRAMSYYTVREARVYNSSNVFRHKIPANVIIPGYVGDEWFVATQDVGSYIRAGWKIRASDVAVYVSGDPTTPPSTDPLPPSTEIVAVITTYMDGKVTVTYNGTTTFFPL